MRIFHEVISEIFNDQSIHLPGIAIAEVKQEKFSYQSDFIQKMRHLRVIPMGFSKYCIGSAIMYPQLKQNNFKAKFLRIKKITKG